MKVEVALLGPNGPYGLCGRKTTVNERTRAPCEGPPASAPPPPPPPPLLFFKFFWGGSHSFKAELSPKSYWRWGGGVGWGWSSRGAGLGEEGDCTQRYTVTAAS